MSSVGGRMSLNAVTRRGFLAAVPTVAIGSSLGVSVNAKDDPILGHIRAELARTVREAHASGMLRPEHVRTMAANVRLLALHASTTTLDASFEQAKKKGSPHHDHEKMRRELQQLGIDPNRVVLTPPDEASVVALQASPQTFSQQLEPVAAHLDRVAARL